MERHEEHTPERRKKRRFPMRREVRYKVVDNGAVIYAGSGYTLDISSGGACFTTQGRLEPGTTIELSISWPVLLDGTCPLRLVTSGKVVRSAGAVAACTIGKFEYRTQGRRSQAPLPFQIPSRPVHAATMPAAS